jgi:hypothetical protein
METTDRFSDVNNSTKIEEIVFKWVIFRVLFDPSDGILTLTTKQQNNGKKQTTKQGTAEQTRQLETTPFKESYSLYRRHHNGI